jgi:hypothetical protein
MKRTVLGGVLAAGLFVIAAVAFARADSSVTLTAKVPFAFFVGTDTLPAGEYTFNEVAKGLLLIRRDRSAQVLHMTYSGASPGSSAGPRVVFHRYGDQYFLSEVYNGTQNASRQIPVSKLEKEQIEAGAHSVVQNSSRHEVIVLATLVTR